MGQEYYAFTIVGQRVRHEDLFTEKIEKEFAAKELCPEHPSEAMAKIADMKYCPECGNQLFLKSKKIENRFPDLFEDKILHDLTAAFGPYKIVSSTHGDHYYIGFIPDAYPYCSQCGGGDAMLSISFVPEEGELAKLTGFLTECGLFNPGEFGLWTVIICSY